MSGMVPQNGQQQLRPGQQQSGFPNFMSPQIAATQESSSIALDSPQVAKQMALLNAANQARISQNNRIPPSSAPPSGGTSSGSYLGAINSHSYPPTNHDLLSNSVNGHANFQIPNNYSHPQSQSSSVNPSFLDPAMSHTNSMRGPINPQLKQRQHEFLSNLAGVMIKRGTPLPPALTGVPSAYDPTNTMWSIIEPSLEVGSFKLAGKDVDLFKLWGIVSNQGGGHAVTNSLGWSSILQHFDLPEEFPNSPVGDSNSVALTLSHYYMSILHPFEEVYKKSIQEQNRKMQMSQQRQGLMPGQQFPSHPSANRPASGMPNLSQSGMRPGNPNGSMGHGPSMPHNGMGQFNPMHAPNFNQRPGSSASAMTPDPHISGTPELDPFNHAVDPTLLDPEMQSMKRKLEAEEKDLKRARQKTDPLESNPLTNHSESSSNIPPIRSNQPMRRKIEYVPLARKIDTYGGRDLQTLDQDLATLTQRRPMRDPNEWGTVDIEGLCMSIRSRLSVELSYALTTFSLLSIMRTEKGTGLGINMCGDLLDDLLDLIEQLAFEDQEDSPDIDSAKDVGRQVTNRELVSLVQQLENDPFAAVEDHQGAKPVSLGPTPRPANIIIVSVNIIRNLSSLDDNVEHLATHPRLVNLLLRICQFWEAPGEHILPCSKVLTLADCLMIRRDTMHIFASIAATIRFSSTSPTSLLAARRALSLVASYLVDPSDSLSPLASVQLAGIPPHQNLKPPSLTDTALEVFTKLSQNDHNRQVIAKAVPQALLWSLLQNLVYRLPLNDVDFILLQRDSWLSFVEKVGLAIYSIVFLSPYELKQKIKSNRNLALKQVLFRLAQRLLTMPKIGIYTARRAIETMKLLDKAEELADASEPTMPPLSFGMGFTDTGNSRLEAGTGILGSKRDVALEILMRRDLPPDEVMFNELDSLKYFSPLSHSISMSDHLPPPTYSQQDPEESQSNLSISTNHTDPQILILPTVDAVNFQKGFLGAEGERASIEGEVHIKGVDPTHWERITISLYSFESAYHQEIELSSTEIELYSNRIHRHNAETAFPSSLPFSIPLLADTPQSLQTPHSMLAHTLTATLYPIDPHLNRLSKSLTVHTRRYSSHNFIVDSAPETHRLEEPTHVSAQLPRSSFLAGEVIPLYVTIPPPTRETVIDRGLRLRNVRAELIRVVKVQREHLEDSDSDVDSDILMDDRPSAQLNPYSALDEGEKSPEHSTSASSSKMPLSPLFLGSSYRVVVARSGASCRFHSTKAIQLRFVLHQNPSTSPSDSRTNLSRLDSDTESALITQSTVLHSVTFHLKVHISFVDTSTLTERISTIVIPISILPPPAPLPEVSQTVDDAYQKKHDRPPVKTNREEEMDPSIPHYSVGEAGPSMLSSGAPPPFDERDAPPPFFMSDNEAASSSRLPTFQESEREIILPTDTDHLTEAPIPVTIPGEGTLFGFASSQQFDGHSDDMQRSSTPPPTLEMASRDPDLTALTEQSSHVTIESFNIVLEHAEETTRSEDQPPPPPPAMDDPSDPPPSIDSDFRSPMTMRQAPQASNSPPPPPIDVYHETDSNLLHTSANPPPVAESAAPSHGTAPPPYLTSGPPAEAEPVVRPPPYVD
ncbi:hypothetical protein CVT24_011539 [Panaeolus cyanescens]|uniref:ARID domain-containing protein n=1 Tax=Panaeolus cyanescens TaxID=181874 RepID=A0A409VMB3_9AGAR|nr:hypothetical protein CVT24_011539 [Panaeolus cyanescens]